MGYEPLDFIEDKKMSKSKKTKKVKKITAPSLIYVKVDRDGAIVSEAESDPSANSGLHKSIVDKDWEDVYEYALVRKVDITVTKSVEIKDAK